MKSHSPNPFGKMFQKLRDLSSEFWRWCFEPESFVQAAPLEGRYYRRTGECHQCGACCQNIYLVHGGQTIRSSDELLRLQSENEEYVSFVPMEQTPEELEAYGLKVRCEYLQPDNRCGIYERRPSFCKRYPTEEILLMGGKMADNCGYRFAVKQTFSQVLGHLQGRDENDRPDQIAEKVIVSTAP